MFKRLLWVSVGIVLGTVIVSKAQAYVRAKTPAGPRQFLLGSDQDNVQLRTLQGLIEDFNAVRHQREAELNEQFASALH